MKHIDEVQGIASGIAGSRCSNEAIKELSLIYSAFFGFVSFSGRFFQRPAFQLLQGYIIGCKQVFRLLLIGLNLSICSSLSQS